MSKDLYQAMQEKAKLAAERCQRCEVGEIVEAVMSEVTMTEVKPSWQLLLHAMTGAFEGAKIPSNPKAREKAKRALAISFLREMVPREGGCVFDFSGVGSVGSYGSGILSAIGALYNALKPGFTISTIATAIGMSSLFPVLGPAAVVIGVAMLARSAAIVVSSIFKIVRGTRREEEKHKILNTVTEFIADAPTKLAQEFTGAIIYAAQKDLTGTPKQEIEDAVERGLVKRKEAEKEAEKEGCVEIQKVFDKNKVGLLAKGVNAVLGTNFGGAADSFWHRAPKRIKAQHQGKSASRSK